MHPGVPQWGLHEAADRHRSRPRTNESGPRLPDDARGGGLARIACLNRRDEMTKKVPPRVPPVDTTSAMKAAARIARGWEK